MAEHSTKDKKQLIAELEAAQQRIRELEEQNQSCVESFTCQNTTDCPTLGSFSLFNALTTPIFFKDKQGRYQGCNKAFENTFNIKKQDFIGKTAHDILPKDVAELYQRKDEEVLSEGEHQIYHSTLTLSSGETRDLFFMKAPVYDANGRPAGVIGEVLDITQQREAEHNLQQSESQYLGLLEALQEGIWRIDENGKTVFVNPRVSDMLQEEHSRLESASILDFIAPEQHKDFHKALQQSKTGVRGQFECRLVRKDNAILHALIEFSPIKNAEDEDAGVILGIMDITYRKGMEEALQKSEKRFRELFDYSPVAYQSLDQNGCFIYVNDELCQLLGYERDELLGTRFGVYFQEEYEQHFQKNFDCFLEEKTIEAELPLRKKGGAPLTVMLRGRIQCDQDGNFVRTHCILVDITERKMAEMEIRRSRERIFATVKATPDLILSINSQGRVMECHAEDIDRFGLQTKKVAGRTLAQVMPLKVADTAMRHVSTVFRTGEMATFEYRSLPWDSPFKAYEARIVKSSANQALVVIRDITEFRQTETALHEANQRLRLAMATAHEGTWECDYAKNLVTLDQQAAKMIGYTPEETLREPQWWVEQIHPEERDNVLAAAERCFKGETTFYTERYRLRSKDGAYLWISGSGGVIRRDEKGAPLLFIGVMRDISAAKEAESALHYSETLYQTLFRSIPMMIYVTDSSGKMVDVNTMACEMHGWSRETILSMRREDLLHKDTLEETANFKEQMKKGALTTGRAKTRRADDSWVEVEYTSTSFTSGENLYRLVISSLLEPEQT